MIPIRRSAARRQRQRGVSQCRAWRRPTGAGWRAATGEPRQTRSSKSGKTLNQVVTEVTLAYGGTVADGFGAFAAASAAAGGNACAAGLLIPLPGGGCDIHPSLEGQRVLAEAIALALGRPLVKKAA